MNLSDARGQLERATGQKLPLLPQLSQRHREAMQKIRQDHDAEIQKIREKADKRIADSAQRLSEGVIESKLRDKLRREESMERQRQDDRVQLAWQRNHRDFRHQIGLGLGPSEQQQLEDELSGAVDDSANPIVQLLGRSLGLIWIGEHIDVRECCDPRLANGHASRKGRYIAIGPIKNIRLAEIAWHETAHILHEELADPSVDRAKPAICRHFKTGHFR